MTRHELYSVHEDNPLAYGQAFPAWLMLTRGIGHDPDDRGGENFRRFPHTKIVRLNNGYGSQGTIPLPPYYEDFATRCAHYVEMSPGCSRWVIGNEPNHRQEWPEGQPIHPSRYTECYTLCRDKIKALPGHEDDEVLVAAVAPWNVDTKYHTNENGDWILYFKDVQLGLLEGGLDGFALHTYVREQTPMSVNDPAKMDFPFANRYWGFQTYKDWMNAILPRFQGLPVYITEFCVAGEPWRNEDTGCVRQAYQEIYTWNDLHPDEPILCLTMYRYGVDRWDFSDKPEVIADFETAVECGYTYPDIDDPTQPPIEPPEGEEMLQNPGLELPYREDSKHSTVKVAHDWTYFASNGKPPERDGPCQLPEYKPLPKTLDPRRVWEGDIAQCWFIRWKIFDAGIYQRVPVEKGKEYKASVMGQAWCSNSDDPTVSDGEMYITLGIDPTGGIDPWSVTVIWPQWQPVGADYKRYYSSKVEAQEDHITLFIRAWNKWELRHNDIYVDDCRLEDLGGETPPPVGGECLFDKDWLEAMVRRVVREEIDKTKLGS